MSVAKNTITQQKHGKTTYIVESLHSTEAKETITTKVIRLIQRELDAQKQVGCSQV